MVGMSGHISCCSKTSVSHTGVHMCTYVVSKTVKHYTVQYMFLNIYIYIYILVCIFYKPESKHDILNMIHFAQVLTHVLSTLLYMTSASLHLSTCLAPCPSWLQANQHRTPRYWSDVWPLRILESPQRTKISLKQRTSRTSRTTLDTTCAAQAASGDAN